MNRKIAFALFVLTCGLMFASRPSAAQQAGGADLERLLRKLDASAAEFRTATADFEFDSVQTDPFPEKLEQKGQASYEHQGGVFRMAARIRKVDGKPADKMYVYAGGALKLYEGGNLNRVTVLSKAGQYEGYLMLGFGASGKELAQKWNIKYLGSETLAQTRTEKLELTPKDPAVARHLPKATIWIDAERGVTLKQLFDQGPDGYRVNVFFNIKVNQGLAKDAFTLPVDGKTVYVNR